MHSQIDYLILAINFNFSIGDRFSYIFLKSWITES